MTYGDMVRLSIPGCHCTHCGTVMGRPLRCAGCGWVDPPTHSDRRDGEFNQRKGTRRRIFGRTRYNDGRRQGERRQG